MTPNMPCTESDAQFNAQIYDMTTWYNMKALARRSTLTACGLIVHVEDATSVAKLVSDEHEKCVSAAGALISAAGSFRVHLLSVPC